MLFLLALNALAAPPCNPPNGDLYVEGEHFWVSWDAAVGDQAEAEQVLLWAEEARATYLELGWEVTDETINVRIEESVGAGGGSCTTTTCPDGTIVPVISLYAGNPGDTSENTTKHEVVHAFEYFLMGTYIDAVTSWAWFAEGTASWLTTHADGDLLEWRLDVRDYIEVPWLGLHQTPLAYLDSVAGPFMYGTAILAQYIEDEHGMQTMQDLWEYGGTQTGTPIYFPDAIEGVGMEWEPFWQDYMAMMTVLDLPYGKDMTVGTFIEKHVGDLPADGSPRKLRQPQGLGLSIIHFKAKAGQEDRSLDVTFDGDPEVEWMAVLVRTKKTGPGGKVKEIVPFDLEDGSGDASLDAFDGANDAYLVVSPQSQDLDPHDYSWSAELGGGPELVEPDEDKGCGCDSAGGSPAWFPMLLLFAAGARRNRPRVSH